MSEKKEREGELFRSANKYCNQSDDPVAVGHSPLGCHRVSLRGVERAPRADYAALGCDQAGNALSDSD